MIKWFIGVRYLVYERENIPNSCILYNLSVCKFKCKVHCHSHIVTISIQMTTMWLFIFLTAFSIVGFLRPIRCDRSPQSSVTQSARSLYHGSFLLSLKKNIWSKNSYVMQPGFYLPRFNIILLKVCTFQCSITNVYNIPYFVFFWAFGFLVHLDVFILSIDRVCEERRTYRDTDNEGIYFSCGAILLYNQS